MKSSTFCIFPSQTPSSFFLSENRSSTSLIQHLTSIHFVKEMAWNRLMKRIELEFKPRLSISESKQPEFETVLTLASQPKFVSHSSPFLSSSSIKSKIPNLYAPIPSEYCNVDARSSIYMLAHDVQNSSAKLSSPSYSSNMTAETRLNKMKVGVTSNHLIKFPALTKNFQQLNSNPEQQNKINTNYLISPEIKTNIHNKLMTMTTNMTSLYQFKQLCLPDPYNHINCTPIEFNDLDSSIMPHEIEDDDHIFMFEEDHIRKSFQVYTMYKRVDKKIHPVSTNFPEDCYVR